jgi:chorismate mutase
MTVLVKGPFTAAADPLPEEKGAPDAPVSDREPWPDRLERTRNAISDVDEALIRLLAERKRLACRAQALRREGGGGGVDPGREERVLGLAAESARKAGLSEELVREVLWRVVALCRPEEDN